MGIQFNNSYKIRKTQSLSVIPQHTALLLTLASKSKLLSLGYTLKKEKKR